MSTRSVIAKVTTDGTVQAVYCHGDGYPSGVGMLLMEHYQDADKVSQLIALGCLSSLGPEIGEKHDFRDWSQNVVRAYHRDRDDDWEYSKPDVFDGGTDAFFARDWEDYGAEWLYIHTPDGWFASKASRTWNKCEQRAVSLHHLIASNVAA